MLRFHPLGIRIWSFAYGLSLPFQAARLLIRTPQLLRLSFFPVLLSFVVSMGLWFESRSQLARWVKVFFLEEAFLGFSNEVFLWTFRAFSQVLLFFLTAIVFSLLSQVLSLPFNDFLAEAVEPHAHPPLKKTKSLPFQKRLKFLGLDLWKTLLTILCQFVLFFFHWIPLVHLFSLPLTFLLVTFQYISYPQTRRGLGIAIGIRFLRRHFFASLGFGMSVLCLFHLPFFSCFFIPLAVIAGTLFVGRAQGYSTYLPLY